MARRSRGNGGSALGGLTGLLLVGGALGVSFTAGAMFMRWLAEQSPVPLPLSNYASAGSPNLPLSMYTLPGRGPEPEGNTLNVFGSNVTYDDEGNFVYDYGDGGEDEGAIELPA